MSQFAFALDCYIAALIWSLPRYLLFVTPPSNGRRRGYNSALSRFVREAIFGIDLHQLSDLMPFTLILYFASIM